MDLIDYSLTLLNIVINMPLQSSLYFNIYCKAFLNSLYFTQVQSIQSSLLVIVVNQITKEERQAANDYMDKATLMQEHTHDQIKQLLKHQ